MSNAVKGHIALFAAQVIYALNYSIAKGLMPGYINPIALVFARVLGATILFWILSLFVKTDKVEKADLKKMAWLAVFGVVINQVFFLYGLSITTPINSSIIMISNPIVVLIITLIILKERIRPGGLIGLVLAILGALIILSYRGDFELGSTTLAGDVMTLVNAISWAIFVVAIKPIMMRYNTVTAMRWVFLFGSIYMLPIGIRDFAQTDWLHFNRQAVFAILFVVVGTTFLAYFLNLYGLQELSPNTVSAYIYLQPLLASCFAITMGNDTLTRTKLVSGGLIVTGLYLVTLKPKKTEP